MDFACSAGSVEYCAVGTTERASFTEGMLSGDDDSGGHSKNTPNGTHTPKRAKFNGFSMILCQYGRAHGGRNVDNSCPMPLTQNGVLLPKHAQRTLWGASNSLSHLGMWPRGSVRLRIAFFTTAMSGPATPPQLDTLVIHADQPDHIREPAYAVAPSISVSTTFHHPHPDSELAHTGHGEPHPEDAFHIYSRYSQDTRVRSERVISGMLKGHALLYSSGLSASDAIADLLLPSTIAIRRGYFGVHGIFQKYAQGRNVKFIDLDDEYPTQEGTPSQEDYDVRRGATLVWLETPLNPTGEARDIEHYAQRAHAAHAYLAVDATLAPPPLQNPFQHGADFVMHSGTKYFGGHSDLLVGIAATQNYKQFVALWKERSISGRVPGSLETFLLLRSLRTMPLRVRHQSATAAHLVQFLYSLTEGQVPAEHVPADIANGRFVKQVWHSSLQPRSAYPEEVADTQKENHTFDPKTQLPNGGSPTFGLLTAHADYAKYLPHFLSYFVPATSLGGVESLIEQRVIASPDTDPRLIRISVGLEDSEDLRNDLLQAMLATLQYVRSQSP